MPVEPHCVVTCNTWGWLALLSTTEKGQQGDRDRQRQEADSWEAQPFSNLFSAGPMGCLVTVWVPWPQHKVQVEKQSLVFISGCV